MKKLISLLLLSLVVSCTVTGPAKDSDDREQEDVQNFGKLRFWQKKEDKKDVVSGEAVTTKDQVRKFESKQKFNTAPSSLVSNSSENLTKPEGNFDAYQQWLHERESNSQSYQDFKEYQEYKEWLELKNKRKQ